MNYLRHFGLREPPFGITPDTSFFFACRGAQEALNVLLVAVANGEGFIKIMGEVGTGKTLLCRRFLVSAGAHTVTAYLPNPLVDPRGLFCALADELGVRAEAGSDLQGLLRAITLYLLDRAREGRRVALCIDEAQAMPTETLEAVRLLTNLETEKRKLLQVVLFGQPELDRRLAAPELRQLAQRITFHQRLRGLDPDELGTYLRHRLAIAGYRGPDLFGADAVAALARASRGVPRLVNILAHKALLALYGEGGQRVARRHVRIAALDTPVARPQRRWWPLKLFAGARPAEPR